MHEKVISITERVPIVLVSVDTEDNVTIQELADPPTNLVISDVTAEGFTATIDLPESGDSIEWSYSPVDEASWVVVGTTDIDDPTFDFTGLDASTLYYIRVRTTGDQNSEYLEGSETTDSGIVLFDPTDLPTLYAWYDLQLSDWKTSGAQDYVTLNGSNISEVEIKSGDQGNLEQLTVGQQPPIGTDGNGKRYIALDRSVNKTVEGHITLAQPFCMYFPLDIEAITGTHRIFNTETSADLLVQYDSAGRIFCSLHGTQFFTSTGAATTGKHLIMVKTDGLSSEIWVDGVLIKSGAVSTSIDVIDQDFYLAFDTISQSAISGKNYGFAITDITDESSRLKMEGFLEHYLELDCLDVEHIYKDNPPEL